MDLSGKETKTSDKPQALVCKYHEHKDVNERKPVGNETIVGLHVCPSGNSWAKIIPRDCFTKKEKEFFTDTLRTTLNVYRSNGINAHFIISD